MKSWTYLGCERSDEYFMKEALKEAYLAFEEGEVPIGAVVVCRDEIIARGHNQVEVLTDPTAHAEVLAITSACNRLNSKYLHQCKLYVTVEPCMMCAGAIRWSRVSEVIYGAAEPKFGFSVFNEKILPRSCKVRAHILSEEAQELMTSFFANKR